MCFYFLLKRQVFRQATFYMVVLLRQATFYSAKLFRQATFHLAALFCQIAFLFKKRVYKCQGLFVMLPLYAYLLAHSMKGIIDSSPIRQKCGKGCSEYTESLWEHGTQCRKLLILILVFFYGSVFK